MAIQTGFLRERKIMLSLIKDFLIFSVTTPSLGTDLVKVSDTILRSEVRGQRSASSKAANHISKFRYLRYYPMLYAS